MDQNVVPLCSRQWDGDRCQVDVGMSEPCVLQWERPSAGASASIELPCGLAIISLATHTRELKAGTPGFAHLC